VPRDSVESIKNVYSGHKRSGSRLATVKTIENGLGERGEKSSGGLEGSESMLRRCKPRRDRRVDLGENEPFQDLRGRLVYKT